jgi:hypothetical protein
MIANAIRQINTIINYFIWKGDIFKVPLSTMLRPKQEGGWGLVNVEAKGKALYYNRIKTQTFMRGTLTGDWLGRWGINRKSSNPPVNNIEPRHLDYIRVVYMYSAYIDERGKEESLRNYKKRLYNTLV